MAENLVQALAILKVSDFEAAEAFYTHQLGFSRQWRYQGSDGQDPSYGGFERDGAGLHVSSFGGDGVSGNAVLIYVQDVDALFAEFTARGVPVELEPTDQPWGTRDMYVRDLDGNCLRFCQSPRTTHPG